MKKIAMILALVVVVSFAAADLNQLKQDHINAMKFNGRADVLAKRNNEMFFVKSGQVMVSCCVTNDLATYYAEAKGRKIYWEVKPIEGGFAITIKFNLFGQTFEKTFKILIGKTSYTVQDDSQDNNFGPCMISCLGTVAQQCIGQCGFDLSCWKTCAKDSLANVASCFIQCLLGGK